MPVRKPTATMNALCGLLLLAGLSPAGAQVPDTATRLAPIRVTVSRDAARPTLELPFGLTRIGLETEREATRRASLTEVLLFVPGVTISNRFNPTQDPRMSVRGFGARSAFGIRGLRVLRDGIPLTVADGQTAVDVVDLESLGAVELFRGSAGALYGNSSGGVVDFRTPAPPDSGGRGDVSGFYAGSIARASLSGARRLGWLGLQGSLSRNAGDGPRDYSTFQSTNALADARWTGGRTQWQVQASLYDAPDAENPGSLTRTELEQSPTIADSLNITRRASKSVRQSLLSLQATRPVGRGTITGNIHGGWRDLENPQSFAIIDLERQTMGASVRAQVPVMAGLRSLRLAVGADWLHQSDDRLNFFNCAGRSGASRPIESCPTLADLGVLTLDQRERVSSLGAYVRGEMAVSSRVSVTGTLRGDRTRFSVLDRLGAPAVELSRSLGAVSPMVGVNWRVGPLSSAYASVSTSFETPTTTELANQPDGSGGLNTELDPQRGITYEVGFKGLRLTGLRYDVALFRIDTEDELIPFEVPGGGGRRFFRNAGQTSRLGMEAAVSGQAGPVSLGTTTTWLRYVYEDFTVSGTSFEGKRVPGVSPFVMAAYASLSPSWGLVALEAQRVGRQAVDDANTEWADAWVVANARIAFRLPTQLAVEPVFGIDNLFDKTYASNVVVNAARGRFYEPGAGRTYYLSIRMGTR
jgi:iron complex outermembrane receptor protein